MPNRPTPPLASRPLHFIWIIDCSRSMKGEKIASLNTIIKEVTPALIYAAQANSRARVLVRAVKFSSGAQWHISDPTPIADFRWIDVAAADNGVTDMGHAMSLLAEQFRLLRTKKGLPPALILISDGYPTDDFESGLNELLNEPWGTKSIRLAIGVGEDADDEVLQKFISNPAIKPFRAQNANDLLMCVQWLSVYALQKAGLSNALNEEDIPTEPNSFNTSKRWE